jgi:hypothetical protein
VISAPDYCEPIVGWRAWNAVECRGETYLMSLFHRVRWPWLEPLAGICSAPQLPWFSKRGRHTAPEKHCQCGIYAASLETAATYVTQSTVRRAWRIQAVRPVIGEVALWGEIVECTNGWRASFAYPQRLILLTADRALEALRLSKELKRYGVPVELSDTPAADDAAVVALVQAIVGEPAMTSSAGISRALP